MIRRFPNGETRQSNTLPVNQYYKEGEYSATIDGVIAAWHKDYLQAVEERKAAEQKETPSQPKQKKTRSREER